MKSTSTSASTSTSNNNPVKKSNRHGRRLTKSTNGIEDIMRESLILQPQQRHHTNTVNGPNDRQPRAITLSDNAKAEPSTILGRAAQRVVERREKLRKAKSDGDESPELLLEAQQKKAALEVVTTSTELSAIGKWVFSYGFLQAFEKIYDDIS
jgi:hypothetical protein